MRRGGTPAFVVQRPVQFQGIAVLATQLVNDGGNLAFQMAEVAISRNLLADILNQYCRCHERDVILFRRGASVRTVSTWSGPVTLINTKRSHALNDKDSLTTDPTKNGLVYV